MKLRDLIEDPDAWKKLDMQRRAAAAADEQFQHQELSDAGAQLAGDVFNHLNGSPDLPQVVHIELGLNTTEATASASGMPTVRRGLRRVNEGREIRYTPGDRGMLTDVSTRLRGELEGLLINAGLKSSQFKIASVGNDHTVEITFS